MMALLRMFSGPDGMKGQIVKLLKTSQDCQLTPRKSFKSIKNENFPKLPPKTVKGFSRTQKLSTNYALL